MNHFYGTVVAITAAVHLAFVGYGVLGGFLALRWPRTIWSHLPVVLWCVAIEIVDFSCPLTALERWARAEAGMAPLPPSGFIDHYLTGVLYPAAYENVVLGLVLLVLVTSWLMVGRPTAVRRILRSHAADR
ncbi:hypothetical protein TUM20985_22590 [Mycobacterium antarcticum]|uniref:DUF2784 domain-containing protein n=1 Tax=unclassified Mycolicibacterium TaxID=2636767 RepID=UPI00238392A3|nr:MULTISPECIES: DUF2784 domain-containing protein [unclassified Mycolicibacterium]BDX31712.1 hypothetical protein TUM20985_22590 [Mycolicibacterium sp. TUM20985]GLP75010.1 hypothetical protein TUM20983_21200 [Mycolicibacterium sp. TUM20983]GLP80798.1 hypothetical protein TUM20984_22180 [Mycolicibacterium sp. TUM20984]